RAGLDRGSTGRRECHLQRRGCASEAHADYARGAAGRYQEQEGVEANRNPSSTSPVERERRGGGRFGEERVHLELPRAWQTDRWTCFPSRLLSCSSATVASAFHRSRLPAPRSTASRSSSPPTTHSSWSVNGRPCRPHASRRRAGCAA